MKKNIFQKKITDSAKRIFLLGIFVYFITFPFQSDAIGETYADAARSMDISIGRDKPVNDPLTGNEAPFPGENGKSSLTGPNLTPYHLTGWSGELVISTNQGDHTDDSPLYDTDTLYIDYAVANLGNVATYGQTFWIGVYLDGISLIRSGPISSLSPNHARYFEDLPVRLSAGTYTITLVVDCDEQIREIDETDNEYSRAITIEARGDEEVQFLSLTTDIGTTLQAGDQITFIASCKGAGPIYYQFFYRAGYGTAAYDGNPWVIMQEFSTSNTCTYSFPNADNYVVVVWACNDPNNIPDDVPLMGINLKVKSQ